MSQEGGLTMVCLLSIVATLSACAMPTASHTPKPVPMTPRPLPPTATAVAPTPMPAPTATNTPEPAGDVWDYVAMGDSFTGRATWPEIYASYLEQDLQLTVLFHDRAVDGQTNKAMLRAIQTIENLREQIRQAELITVHWGATTLEKPHTLYKLGACGGTDGRDCLREASSSAEADWEALLDKLVALRPPEEAHIVTFRTGAFLAQRMCDWGSECWEGLLTHLVEWNDFIERTAIEHGIHVVDVDQALTGSDYRQRTNERHFQGDGFHLSEEGSIIVADLLRQLELGVEPSVAP